MREFHPPNFEAARPGRAGPVAPTYAQGPAPMGIADLGLRNSSGTIVPYEYNTSSVWGTITLTRAQAAYVDGDGPDTFGVQLNAVATNVTLFNATGYEFWTQDFFSYTSSTHTLSFGDNVWNFSSFLGPLPADVFASTGPNGTLVVPVFYYALGPTITISYPFTVSLYLNASLFGDRPAVYFNYTVSNGSGLVSGGSFDRVVFNSTPVTVVAPAPKPAFQVDGYGVNPVGLPNDAELVLVGNGGGDTTTFFVLNATMALRSWSARTGGYVSVPAAFDAGSDTGETCNGVLPVYRLASLASAPTVTLAQGPSFVQGLWNVSQALNGSRQFRLTQHPQNAFLFVTPGAALDPSLAQWVPTIRVGQVLSNFSIPNVGTYTFSWMLSDRTQLNMTFNPVANSTTTLVVGPLAIAAAAGAYTPLLAWGNAELGAITQGGDGTAGNPYVVDHRPVGPLNPVFGQLNDYGFPVFAGVLLINTTSYVTVTQPSVEISYGSWMDPFLTYLGLPSTNDLQVEFWNVTNVAVVNSTGLSGWLSTELTGFPEGEVLFWGSSGNLVGGNSFHDQGIALTLYGGSGNTVWGNTILEGAVEPSFYGGNAAIGIVEWESGDLLYNNYLAVPVPAVTPTFDVASCQIVCEVAVYADAWNVSLEPASASQTVLGETLTGSILGTTYQGGNYWSNYGTPSNPFGGLPYNDSGAITVGGDYYPLYLTAISAVTFIEQGFVQGVPWSVTMLGVTTNSTSNFAVAYAPNGSFNYSVAPPAGYAGPGPGVVVVDGSDVFVLLNFSALFAITVTPAYLPVGWSWSVWFNVSAVSTGVNTTLTSGAGSAVVELVNGTYDVAATAYGFVAAGLSPITVDGAPASVSIVPQ